MPRFLTTLLLFAMFADSAAAQTLHFIGVADVHSNLAVYVKDDMRRMNNTLINGINDQQLSLNIAPDRDVTPEKILQFIKRLPNVQRTDTIVFYYTGHGAWDRDKGQFYTISDPAHSYQRQREESVKYIKPLLKSEVIAAIQAHSPKLTVIINDCCSSEANYDAVAAMGKWDSEPRKDPTFPLFRSLFFEQSGLVDFAAAQDRQAGLCYPQSAANAGKSGSVLTYCLTDRLNSMRNTVSAWEKFFPLVQAASEADAKTYCSEEMKPKAFSLGHAATREQPKFGVRALTRDDGTGVMVTEVVKGLPGALAGLEQGDVILEIDGKTLRNEKDYSDAVDAAGNTMRLKVRNARNNQIIETKAVFNR